MTIEKWDPIEMAAAAKLCAACEHEANEHGVCVFCGALKPMDAGVTWEPPVRRSRLFTTPARVETPWIDRKVLGPVWSGELAGQLRDSLACQLYVTDDALCGELISQLESLTEAAKAFGAYLFTRQRRERAAVQKGSSRS